MTQWEPVIGLEVHVQLSTQAKLFSSASTAFGAAPNSQASIIDLGLPGTLPVLNQAVIKKAVLFGLAVHADINHRSVFERKNYFYPDLPKGYQISQLQEPIVGEGHIDIVLDANTRKRIGITRAHLEEDAGKSLHSFHGSMTGIDLNRAGTPLLEIVSEPDIRSPQEAVAYLKALHAIIRYLDISDGNMAEGSMRCDANVSIRPVGSDTLGTRTEIKNVNSFRFIEKAIQYEIDRQIDVLEDGGTITQETRLYDSDRNETRSMRSKEDAQDYRYFPDPDLPPIELDEATIEAFRQELPELPEAKAKRFEEALSIPQYDAAILCSDRDIATFFEQALAHSNDAPAKTVANWVITEWLGRLNKESLEPKQSPLAADHLGQLVARIADKTLSGKLAKQVFDHCWQGEGSPDEIIEAQGLKQVTDSSVIQGLVESIVAANPDQVSQYQNAPDDKRKKLVGFFMGQVMKASQGTANPQEVNKILHDTIMGHSL